MNKMKQTIALFALAFGLLGSNVVHAEAIAVLNPEKAMFATQEAVELGQQLSERLQPQAARFEQMGQDLRALQARLETDKDLMTADEVQGLKNQIQNMNVELQQLQQYLNNSKLKAEQDFVAQMKPKLDRVLRQVIQENNISLIINGQSIIYNAPGVDITSKVVELLNLEQ